MYSDYHLYFEDVEIGQEWISQGRTITETDIVNFAGLSGDFNPIHVDHEFAKKTPFRRPIAHGLMVFCVASGLGVSIPPMRTMAFVKVCEWNFMEPIYAGDTIRIRSRVVEKTLKGRGRRGEILWLRTIFNQHDRVVQEGKIITLIEGRGMIRSREREAERQDERSNTPV